MRTRFLILIGAVLMALGLLGLTYWLGGPEDQATGRLPAAADLDLSDLPPVGHAPQSGSRDVDDLAATVEQGRYAMVEPGRQTVVEWQRMTPKPQGISEVELPRATITFLDARERPRQKVTIVAQEGTFVAPGNQFRTGEFRRNVVLTLFEAPEEGGEVRTDRDEHVVFRAYLDENATFEMELGQVTSRGPVQVTGPEVDFLGTGLNLKFNRLRNRIEFLEVVRGERLRLARRDRPPAAQAPADAQALQDREPEAIASAPAGKEPPAAADSARAEAAAASHPVSPAAPVAGGRTVAEGGGAPLAAEKVAVPRQFYRARFFDRVRVEMAGEEPQDRLALQAAYLELFFSLGAARTGDPLQGDFSQRFAAPSADSLAAATGLLPAPFWPASPVAAVAQLWSVAALAQGAGVLAESRSLMRPDPHDLVVHWSGRLILEPEPAPPAGLREKEDLSVRVTGTVAEPVLLESGSGMRLRAAEAVYFSPTTRFQATGAADVPLLLASEEVGTLSGQRLELDHSRGTGYVSGPGWLRQAPQPVRVAGGAGPGAQAEDEAGKNDSEELALAVSPALVFKDVRPDAASDPDLAAAESSTEVLIMQPGLEIAWQNRLDLSFFLSPADQVRSSDQPSGPELAAGRLQGLRQAAFEGAVAVQHPELDLEAQRLVIDWQPRPDQPQRSEPRRIQAAGGVVTRQVGLNLKSDELDVALAARPSDRDGQDPATTVQSLTATGAVDVQLDEQELRLRGHRLVAQPQDDQLDLYAQGEIMAEVVRPDGRLLGQHVIVRRQEQLVRVQGQGRFEMQIDAQDPDARLAVTWQDRMRFDNAAGAAHFVGRSSATTWTREDETHLDSQELTLHFYPFEGLAQGAPEVPAPTGAEPVASESSEESEPADELLVQELLAAGGRAGDGASETAGNTADTLAGGEPAAPAEPAQAARPDASGEPETLEMFPDAEAEGVADAFAPIRAFPDALQHQAEGSETADTKTGGEDAALERRGIRQLKRMEASGRVVFVAAAFSDPEHRQPLSRLRIEGPSLTFDTPEEFVRVEGAGRMLIEDYRPLAGAEAQAEQSPLPRKGQSQEPVLFSGRGQTLFTWQRDLNLDLAVNDMTQRGDVWMIHRPQTPAGQVPAEGAAAESIQLYCQELLVDLQNTGGLGAWFSGRSPDVRIDRVTADRGVRLTHGQAPGIRTLLADHLLYDAARQSVRLWADPGQVAQVSVEGEPAPLRAEAFTWDLVRDRIRAENPVGGVVPVAPGRGGGAGGRSRR